LCRPARPPISLLRPSRNRPIVRRWPDRPGDRRFSSQNSSKNLARTPEVVRPFLRHQGHDTDRSQRPHGARPPRRRAQPHRPGPRQRRRPGCPAPAGRASPRRVRPGLRREGQHPQGPPRSAPASPWRSTTCAVVTRSSSGSWTGLGRSVKEVLTIADDLHARGIGVRILTGKLSGSYSGCDLQLNRNARLAGSGWSGRVPGRAAGVVSLRSGSAAARCDLG
jgi:hypothetical protein